MRRCAGFWRAKLPRCQQDSVLAEETTEGCEQTFALARLIALTLKLGRGCTCFAADGLRLARCRKYAVTSRRSHPTRLVGSNRIRLGNWPFASSRSMVAMESGTTVSSSARNRNGDST